MQPRTNRGPLCRYSLPLPGSSDIFADFFRSVLAHKPLHALFPRLQRPHSQEERERMGWTRSRLRRRRYPALAVSCIFCASFSGNVKLIFLLSLQCILPRRSYLDCLFSTPSAEGTAAARYVGTAGRDLEGKKIAGSGECNVPHRRVRIRPGPRLRARPPSPLPAASAGVGRRRFPFLVKLPDVCPRLSSPLPGDAIAWAPRASASHERG
ncbi:hypothetical protein C8R45DRAFT_973515 [Mycena sanguinolenta]|nr:hypothetical protein C8R45DRAFT_973515 [Mycena sanguinolenta]